MSKYERKIQILQNLVELSIVLGEAIRSLIKVIDSNQNDLPFFHERNFHHKCTIIEVNIGWLYPLTLQVNYNWGKGRLAVRRDRDCQVGMNHIV